MTLERGRIAQQNDGSFRFVSGKSWNLAQAQVLGGVLTDGADAALWIRRGTIKAVVINPASDLTEAAVSQLIERPVQTRERPRADHRRPDSFVPAYNYVPLSRSTDPDLMRGPGVGHHILAPDRLNGALTFRITTRTPLLLHGAPERASVHVDVEGTATPVPTYATRRRVLKETGETVPDLAPSTVRGMLRTAFEAVTGSSFGIFAGHDEPLVSRSLSNDAAKAVPLIVTAVGANTVTVQTRGALRLNGHQPRPGQQPPSSAVSVQRRRALADTSGAALKPALTTHSVHQLRDSAADLDGREVEAWIYLMHHQVPGETRSYDFWRAAAISALGHLGTIAPPPDESTNSKRIGRPVRVRGVLHWTGARFSDRLPGQPGSDRKHDERLFVTAVVSGSATLDPARRFGIDAQMIAAWNRAIESYRDRYKDLIRNGTSIGDGAGDYVDREDRWQLTTGRTLWGLPDPRGGLAWIGPAMIGRLGYALAPGDLVGEHGVAATEESLSPADRVFGWAAPRPNSANDGDDSLADDPEADRDDRGSGGYASHVAVSRVDLVTPATDAIKPLDSPVPLATLASPKPSNYKFSLRRKSGEAISGEVKQVPNGFTPDQIIAGFKTYTFDADLLDHAEYWTPPVWPADPNGYPVDRAPTSVTVQGRQVYREYVAPKNFKPSQTRIVTDWVPAGVTFEATLSFHNLSRTELAALAWLVSLPGNAMLRLGYGKPLGFGVVGVECARGETWTGQQARQSYRNLALPASTAADVDALVAHYDAVLAADEMTATRDAFLALARGFHGIPVHLPRADNEPVVESFEWWSMNERQHRLDNMRGQYLGLPVAVQNPPDLPYEPKGPGAATTTRAPRKPTARRSR